VLALSSFLGNIFDTKILDGLVDGVGKLVNWLSKYVRRIQTGSIAFYLFLMTFCIVLILAFNLYPFLMEAAAKPEIQIPGK